MAFCCQLLLLPRTAAFYLAATPSTEDNTADNQFSTSNTCHWLPTDFDYNVFALSQPQLLRSSTKTLAPRLKSAYEKQVR